MENQTVQNSYGYVTPADLSNWQSQTIEKISELNIDYLNASISQIGIVLALVGLVAIFVQYFIIKDQREKLENQILEKVNEIESTIYSKPRVGQLVIIGNTVYEIISFNGYQRIGFPTTEVLDQWYPPKNRVVLPANLEEREIPDLHTLTDRKPNYERPIDQAMAELEAQSLLEKNMQKQIVV